jgi:hypothetical protein
MKNILILFFLSFVQLGFAQFPLQFADTVYFTSGAKIACQYKTHTSKLIAYKLSGEKGIQESAISDVSRVSFYYNKEAQNSINRIIGNSLFENDNLWKAGQDLKRGSAMWYSGMLVSLVGGGLSIAGAATRNNALSFCGAAVGGVGFTVGMISFSQIGKAGKRIQHSRY